jgi:hypothetical protein
MRPAGPWVLRGWLQWRRRAARAGLAGRPVAGQGEVEEAHTRDEKADIHLCRRRAPGGNERIGGLLGAADHGTEWGLRCASVRVRLGKAWSLGTAHGLPVVGPPWHARTVVYGIAWRGAVCGVALWSTRARPASWRAETSRGSYV